MDNVYEYYPSTVRTATFEITTDDVPLMTEATETHIGIIPESGATGTATIEYKRKGGGDYISVVERSGAPVVVDLSLGDSFFFKGMIQAIRVSLIDAVEGIKIGLDGYK